MKKLEVEDHAAALETLVMAGAAGVTAAIWLAIAGLAFPHEAPAPAMRYVTLPTVHVVGRLPAEVTPATTTAQNTVTNPVTLAQ